MVTKKVLVLVLACMLILVMLGCVSAEIVTVEYGGYTFEIDNSIPLKDREIVSVFENVSHPFGACLNAGIEAAAEEFSVNAYQMGGTSWDAAESVEIMDALVTKGVDVICIAAIDVDAFTAAAQRAMEAGVMVVGYNSPLNDENQRMCHVGVDIYSVAKAVTDPLCEAVYNKYGGGKLLIFGDLAANEPVIRARALADSIASYPEGVFELIELNSNGDDASIYADIENAFNANPDIVGTYSVSGCQYLVAKYLKENGIGNVLTSDEPIYSVGHDLFEECLYNLLDGWEYLLVSQDPFNQGYVPIKLAVDFFTTYDVNSFVNTTLDPVVVSATEAQNYIDQINAGIPVG